MPKTELPQRLCVGCRQTDDHPRHDEVLQVQPEMVVASWHLDCCALIKGCVSCAEQVEGADGKTGQAMREHVINRAKRG